MRKRNGTPGSYPSLLIQRDPEKLRSQDQDIENKDKLAAELFQKVVTPSPAWPLLLPVAQFATYGTCGLNTVLVVPALTWLLGVDRPGGGLACWTGGHCHSDYSSCSSYFYWNGNLGLVGNGRKLMAETNTNTNLICLIERNWKPITKFVYKYLQNGYKV